MVLVCLLVLTFVLVFVGSEILSHSQKKNPLSSAFGASDSESEVDSKIGFDFDEFSIICEYFLQHGLYLVLWWVTLWKYL